MRRFREARHTAAQSWSFLTLTLSFCDLAKQSAEARALTLRVFALRLIFILPLPSSPVAAVLLPNLTFMSIGSPASRVVKRTLAVVPFLPFSSFFLSVIPGSTRRWWLAVAPPAVTRATRSSAPQETALPSPWRLQTVDDVPSRSEYVQQSDGRPADGARHVLPSPGGRRRTYARRLGDALRR